MDSEWRDAFDYVKQTKIVYTTSAGERYIYVRLLEEPKSYEGEIENGKSPFLTCESTVVMTVASDLPFYLGETAVYEWEWTSAQLPGGAGMVRLEIGNDSDVPVWPRWTLTGGATWTLPDFSWGSEEYSRGLEDGGRLVDLPPLSPLENVVVDSDPRKQTILSSNLSNVQGRWKGNDLLYPIEPGEFASVPVSVSNVTVGKAAFRLEIPRWYTRPWSRPRP